MVHRGLLKATKKNIWNILNWELLIASNFCVSSIFKELCHWLYTYSLYIETTLHSRKNYLVLPFGKLGLMEIRWFHSETKSCWAEGPGFQANSGPKPLALCITSAHFSGSQLVFSLKGPSLGCLPSLQAIALIRAFLLVFIFYNIEKRNRV